MFEWIHRKYSKKSQRPIYNVLIQFLLSQKQTTVKCEYTLTIYVTCHPPFPTSTTYFLNVLFLNYQIYEKKTRSHLIINKWRSWFVLEIQNKKFSHIYLKTINSLWPALFAVFFVLAFLGFTCPPEAKDQQLGQEEYRYFRSPSDCQKYYVCVDHRPRLYNCGEGKAFNDLKNACDGVENVTGCAIPQYQNELRGVPSKGRTSNSFSGFRG